MKKIGFIGGYDKTDFILYVGKILTVASKKVLILDTTISQKAKYIIPAITPTFSYVTHYENMDVAVGFEDTQSIAKYLLLEGTVEENYDYMLFDIDSAEALNKFDMIHAAKNYFVTSFDLYSIKKGLEVLSGLKEPLDLTKVLFSKQMTKEEDDYFNFIALGYKANWNEYRIYFPLEQGDQSAIIENQMVSKIKFKNLSTQYRESLEYIAEELLEELNVSGIKKVFKLLEKGE